MTRTAVDCVDENKRLVPLMKVVKAAIIDQYGDLNSNQQRYLHFAGRSFQDLNRQVLKMGGRKVLLTVNQSTKTATLPLDFEYETFLGVIDALGQKIPIKINHDLADNCNYEDITAEDKCTSCGQDKTICEDLQVTEDIELVVINNTTYENSIIKKLYPNGDYYLETKKYIKNVEDNTVSPFITKEFITNLGLKPCGCLETTTDNIAAIRTYLYDTYCNYYSGCNPNCGVNESGYTIFPETGLIQFDFNFPYTKVALEYTGFLPKKNGQFMVPAVAFETLVEHIKWKSIKDRKGMERWRIRDTYDDYVKARKTMMKMLTRVSLSSIIAASRRAPKFEVDFGNKWYSYFNSSAFAYMLNGISGGAAGSGTGTGSNTTTIVNNNNTVVIENASYELAVRTGDGVGHPVQGQSTYQNNLLIGATTIEYILVAKQVFTLKDGDFAFNPTTGTISISPNTFVNGDTLIIPYNKPIS